MKSYCTQNGGDCASCSLVNYGRDCRNLPINEAGPKPGHTDSVPKDRPAVKVHGLDAEFMACPSCCAFGDDFEDLAGEGLTCPLCGEGIVRTVTRREFFGMVVAAIVRELL